MRALSGPELLDVWETGRDLHPLDQALLAIRAGRPDETASPASEWPLGRRNRVLIDLHRQSFGSDLMGWASCTACGDKMEFSIDTAALIGPDNRGRNVPDTIRFGESTFRLPNSRDLAGSMQQPPDTAAAWLLERCRTGAGEAGPFTDVDVESIGEAMAAADPLSDIRLALACPACGHTAEETLDMARFLWAKIEARARTSVQEVHELASAYGWSEAMILALTPARRALYLEQVRR